MLLEFSDDCQMLIFEGIPHSTGDYCKYVFHVCSLVRTEYNVVMVITSASYF